MVLPAVLSPLLSAMWSRFSEGSPRACRTSSVFVLVLNWKLVHHTECGPDLVLGLHTLRNAVKCVCVTPGDKEAGAGCAPSSCKIPGRSVTFKASHSVKQTPNPLKFCRFPGGGFPPPSTVCLELDGVCGSYCQAEA